MSERQAIQFEIEARIDKSSVKKDADNISKYISKKFDDNTIQLKLKGSDIQQFDKIVDSLAQSKEDAIAIKKIFAEQNKKSVSGANGKLISYIEKVLKDSRGNINQSADRIAQQILKDATGHFKQDDGGFSSADTNKILNILKSRYGVLEGIRKLKFDSLPDVDIDNLVTQIFRKITLNADQYGSTFVTDLMKHNREIQEEAKKNKINVFGNKTIDDLMESQKVFSEMLSKWAEGIIEETKYVAEELEGEYKETEKKTKRKVGRKALKKGETREEFGEDQPDNQNPGGRGFSSQVDTITVTTLNATTLVVDKVVDKDGKQRDLDFKQILRGAKAETIKGSVFDIPKNWDQFEDYLDVISHIMDITKGWNSIEVGYNGKKSFRLGDERSVSTNTHTKSHINFHNHPWKGYDSLAPSVGDINAYTKQIINNLATYGKSYLKKAFISNGDRLLEMDFSNIKFKTAEEVKQFKAEIVEAMAELYRNAGGTIKQDKNGTVTGLSLEGSNELINQVAAGQRGVVKKIFEKYGGDVRIAQRDAEGNFVDTTTQEKWIAEYNQFNSKNAKAAKIYDDASDKYVYATKEYSRAVDKLCDNTVVSMEGNYIGTIEGTQNHTKEEVLKQYEAGVAKIKANEVEVEANNTSVDSSANPKKKYNIRKSDKTFGIAEGRRFAYHKNEDGSAASIEDKYAQREIVEATVEKYRQYKQFLLNSVIKELEKKFTDENGKLNTRRLNNNSLYQKAQQHVTWIDQYLTGKKNYTYDKGFDDQARADLFSLITDSSIVKDGVTQTMDEFINSLKHAVEHQKGIADTKKSSKEIDGVYDELTKTIGQLLELYDKTGKDPKKLGKKYINELTRMRDIIDKYRSGKKLAQDDQAFIDAIKTHGLGNMSTKDYIRLNGTDKPITYVDSYTGETVTDKNGFGRKSMYIPQYNRVVSETEDVISDCFENILHNIRELGEEASKYINRSSKNKTKENVVEINKDSGKPIKPVHARDLTGKTEEAIVAPVVPAATASDEKKAEPTELDVSHVDLIKVENATKIEVLKSGMIDISNAKTIHVDGKEIVNKGKSESTTAAPSTKDNKSSGLTKGRLRDFESLVNQISNLTLSGIRANDLDQLKTDVTEYINGQRKDDNAEARGEKLQEFRDQYKEIKEFVDNVQKANKRLNDIKSLKSGISDTMGRQTDRGKIYTTAFEERAHDVEKLLDNSEKDLNDFIEGKFTGDVQQVFNKLEEALDLAKQLKSDATRVSAFEPKAPKPPKPPKPEKEPTLIPNSTLTSAQGVYQKLYNTKAVKTYSDLSTSLSEYLTKLRNSNNITQEEYEVLKNEGIELKNKVNEIDDLIKEYDKLIGKRKELAKLEAEGKGEARQTQLRGEIESEINSLQARANDNGVGNYFEEYIGNTDQIEAVAKTYSTKINNLKKQIEDAMTRKKQQGYGYITAFDDEMARLLKNMNDTADRLLAISADGVNAAEELQRANELIEKSEEAYINVQSNEKVTVKKSQLAALTGSAENLSDNTRVRGVTKEDRAEIDQIVFKLKEAQLVANGLEGELTQVSRLKYDDLATRIKELTNKYQELGLYGSNAFQRIFRSIRAQSIAAFSRYFSLYDIIRYVRTGVNTVKELDTAMVELRKVTDGTAKAYEDFRKEIRATATEIASTNKDLISSAADWARLGYSIKEATDLAKDAQVFVNVGDGVDIKGATDMMITAMKAFDITADQALSIVDKYNEIGNNFALSATDIGDAMQRSASVLAASNTSFDESIALITAGNEILQDPEKTGTALRTIALRIRGAKSELEEMGEETDYVVKSTSKLRDLIKGYTSIGGKYEGFDIMEDENTFKSLADIIKGIGKVYDEMSDIDRTAMLEKLAGKNRSNALAAMLQNYEQIDNVLKSIEESEGSALEENAHIVDSIQGRITILQTTAENFWQTFLDTDAVKEAVTALTSLLDILTKIVDTTGAAPILSTAAGLGIIRNGGGFQRYRNNVELRNRLTTENQAFRAAYEASKEKLASATNTYNVSSNYDDTQSNYTRMSEAAAELNKDFNNLTQSEEALRRQNQITGQSFKNDLVKSLIGVGVTAAISAVIALISKGIQDYKKLQQATRDFASETRKSGDALGDYAKRIAEAKKTLDDENSSTDQIREAKQSLIDIQNELNESYDSYNKKIKDVNTSLEESIELLIEQQKTEMSIAAGKTRGDDGWANIGRTTEEKTNAAITGNRGLDLNSSRLHISDSEIDLMSSLGVSTSRWDAMTEGIGLDFHSDDIYTLRSQVVQAINLLQSEQYENNKTAQKVEKILSKELSAIDEDLGEYGDAAYNLGGNFLSTNQVSSAAYDKAMSAALHDSIEGTDASHQAAQEAVNELYEIAKEAGSDCGMYFVKEFFKEYRDGIDQIDFEDTFGKAINVYGRDTTVGAQLGKFAEKAQSGANGLTAEEVEAYLRGQISQDKKEKLTADEKEWLDFISEYISDYGLNIDDVVSYLRTNGYLKTEKEISYQQDYADAQAAAKEKFGMSEEDFNRLGISNDEQLTMWLKIAEASKNASDATRMMSIYMSEVATSTSASNILKDMQEQYKPTFDAMAEAYKAIWNESDVFQGTEKVTSAQIDSVRSQLESVNSSLKENGLDMIDSSEIDSFILTLSDADATAEEVQGAFNNIATVLVDSLNPAIAQASGETAELMQKTLAELGVTNAEEVVFSRLGYTAETYAKAKEAASAAGIDLDAELSSLSVEQLELVNSTEDLYNYYYGKMLANGTEVTSPEEIQQLLNYCNLLGVTQIGTLNLASAERDLASAMALVSEGIRTGNMELKARGEAQIEAIKKDVNAAAKAGVGYGVETKFNGNKNKSSSSSTSASETKQKFDWIERAIKKIQRAVSNLGKVADATYKSWGERLDAIMGKTQEFHDEIGRFGQGNIDLYNRPQYINEDGSISTVRSMSFGDEFGNEILVPTIAFDNNGNPYSMSDDEAIARYYETGEYLGLFKSIEEAEEYAEKLHEQQDALYVSGGNSFYAGKYQKLKEEISLQEQAAQAYMQEANAIGLAAEYKNKVMNGMMDIETITDETLKEQISDFQEYYDKATDAADAVEDLRGELAQLAQVKFDMITKQFEEMALSIDHAATRIGHLQSKLNSEGYFESSTFIENLLFGDKEKLGQLEDEARQLAASIDEAVTNGDIEYGSEQWWGMYDSLQNVNDQIIEMKSNMADLNDQLRQMEWDRFDYVHEVIEDIVDENEFLIDTLEAEQQLFEKVPLMGTETKVSNGNWTDAAYAVQGLHVNSMQTYEQLNIDAAEELKRINEELAKDPNNKKLLDRKRQLIKQQQTYIKGIQSEKKAIVELAREGYEKFLDYLQKSIDKRKEALEAQKSLYDYERTVADQTKAIADYRKQLAALGGDDSEENRARLQQLKDDLTKAEKDLQDTEYERWLSDQEEMMDNMYESFENLINERLDDVDGLIERATQQTKDNSDSISGTIEDQADEFIYDLDNTSFGVNFDARISDAVAAVNAVESAINTMITNAETHAQNELNALGALAQTVANQAAVQAQYTTPVSVNTNNNGGGGGGGTTTTSTTTTEGTKTTNSGLSRDNAKKYGDLMTQYQKFVDLANALQETADEKARKDAEKAVKDSGIPEAQAAIRNQVYMGAYKAALGKYEKQIEDYMKTANDFKKQADALKNAAYAKGGTIGSAIKSTGEDGIILARSGEEVLSLERIKQMQGIFKMMQPLAALGTNKTISNIGGTTTVNGMNVSFELPNVTSYEDFVRQAKNDPNFEKLVQNMTIGTALGKSKLSKYSL